MPHHKRSRRISFIDSARIESLLRPLLPDQQELEFVTRCLLQEGPEHHRGANYVLLSLLGELIKAPLSPATDGIAVSMNLPPHLRSGNKETEYPLRIPSRVLERLAKKDSREFSDMVDGYLAVRVSQLSGAHLRWVALSFAIFMYVVSGVVNNLTALLLILPILLALLRLLELEQRSLSWCLGILLVACNLGGAATPIGDFPAILLLGRGSMGFGDYLLRAAPMTLLALLMLLAVTYFIVRPYPKYDN